TLTFDPASGTTMANSGIISGAGAVNQIGAGTTILTAANTYIGTTNIDAGTMQMGVANAIADSSAVTVVTGATLDLNGNNQIVNDLSGMGDVTLGTATLTANNNTNTTFGGTINGTGALTKIGASTLTLIGDNGYTGGTTINAGTLQLGDGTTNGSIVGDVTDNATLASNPATGTTITSSGIISGTGVVNQMGNGITMLTAANTYTGTTTVSTGALYINGDQTGATGITTVASGATLGGTGTIGGSVTVQSGGTLAPGDVVLPGMLTIDGDLTLNSGSTLNYRFGEANANSANTATGATGGGGALNDLTQVTGNLTLEGSTLNVTVPTEGSFDPGVYRIFNYQGILTGNASDITLGAMPSGSKDSIQTSVSGQVNLVNTATITFNFWDGDPNYTGVPSNGAIEGGSGTWTADLSSTNWTNMAGTTNSSYAQGSLAVFEGAPGTVTVDNSANQVISGGMDFVTSGYIITGDPITLAETETGTGATEVNVGDGTPTSSSTIATINSVLQGTTKLEKEDYGTLILTADNTYTGGTAIDAGTLQLGDGVSSATNGSIIGNVTNNGTLAFDPASGTIITNSGVISGTGDVNQIGAGTALLTGVNIYIGTTNIDAGTLALSGTGSIALSSGVADDGTFDISGTTSGASITTLSGSGTVNLGAQTLTLTAANDTFSGSISDGGAGGGLTLNGGAETLTSTSSYSGNTAINLGALTISDAGSVSDNTGYIGQNSGNNGTVTVDGSNGGAIWMNSGWLYVGNSGIGKLNITDGGTVSNTFVGYIGNNTDSTGTVTVSGTASTWMTNGLLIGNYGIGSMSITAGGTVSNSSYGNIGDMAGSQGTVTVDGTGSTWTNSDYLDIGAWGTGTLSITNGGSVSNLSSDIGDVSGSQGTVTVDGVGSTWTNFSVLSIGTYSTGTLSITNGGTVSSLDGYIGFNTGALGVVTVDGMGSTWATSTIDVGFSGTGTLTISDNGKVSTNGVAVGVNGGIGVINIGSPDGTAPVVPGTLDTPSVFLGATGSLVFNHTGDSYTFAPIISGTGLVLQEAGITIFTATETYTGDTTISGGMLQLGDGTTNGSMVGNVTDDATLAFDPATGTTITNPGIISGTGAVTQIGAGTTILTAANTYTGGTTISAGTLQIGDGTTNGSIIGDIADNATLTFDPASGTTMTNPGIISGNGAADQIGAGTTILSEDNTYTGLTTINAGTLQLGNGGTTGNITGNVLNDSILAFDRSDASTYSGTLNGTGELVQNGSGTTTLSGAGSTQGSVSVQAGGLTFSQAGAFTTTGNYETETGATTSITGANSSLTIEGEFIQDSSSTLSVT
ncbi:MAG: autotransporter-associated beta strand repeat-containing protein, partial [Desulfuromonadales bacterium]|nr:autotransporter-associated beta strand repeat-containing protein [Desulfuromonadales bacterium]